MRLLFITIQGNEMFGGGGKATKVTLAGIPALIVGDDDNAKEIVVQASAGPLDTSKAVGDVVITSDVGVEITLVNGFTYSLIEDLQSESGQGGTRVTISGFNSFVDLFI